MRASYLVIGALVLGLGLGALSGYGEVGGVAEFGPLEPGSATGDAVEPRGPQFKIDATSFDFGTMERGATLSHAFTVTNEGSQPLVVTIGATSCKCTGGKMKDEPLMPGESDELVLEWTAKVPPGDFRQWATIHSNDPRSPRVELEVVGQVTEISGLIPQDWFFGRVRAGSDKTESIYLMSYQQESFNVVSMELEGEGANYFDAEAVAVDPSELPDPNAKAGYRLDTKLKPGVPLGQMNYWVVVKTDLPKLDVRRVPISGLVEGDISIHGSGWLKRSGKLNLGFVRQSEGATKQLYLSVKGEHAKDTKFELSEITPPDCGLEVELGEPVARGDEVVHVPMTIKVPVGLSARNYLGTQQGEAAHVTIRTTHPHNPEIGFDVEFGVRP